jgi:hypothetical protein
MTLVDDFGRYDGRAALLHGECFSLRNDRKPQRTAALLQELHAVGLIQLYAHEGKEYLQVLRWQERSRCEKSKYPEPTVIPQDSAADRREKTLPSPSPSPSPLVIASVPAAFAASALFLSKWEKWQSTRKAMGKKPKDWTEMFQEQINWLEQYPTPVAIEILSASIRNNWQGLHEPKSNNGHNSKHTTESNRNVGTANEGRSSQYAGVGKIKVV